MKKSLLIILILFGCLNLQAQDHNSHQDHSHSHDNEFSLAIGLIPHHELSLGLHAHYIKGVAFDNKIGLGISYETIFDQHAHHSLSLIGLLRPLKQTSVAYAVGVLYVAEEQESQIQLAQHVELAYEIPMGQFHIGPQIDLGIEDEGLHIMYGVHFGIEF